MVLLLLALLLVETLTGLYVANDIADVRPLTAIVPAAAANAIDASHAILSNVLVAAIAAHVLAIVIYAVIKGRRSGAAACHRDEGAAGTCHRATDRERGARGCPIRRQRRGRDHHSVGYVVAVSSWEEPPDRVSRRPDRPRCERSYATRHRRIARLLRSERSASCHRVRGRAALLAEPVTGGAFWPAFAGP